MQTIQPINPAEAGNKARRLLQTAQAELGLTTNLIKTMAHAPSALDAYLQLHRARASSMLPEAFRVQVALTVAQAQQCDYALAEHTSLARQLGISEEEILESRQARSRDSKTAAALRFVRSLVQQREAHVPDLHEYGYSDWDIIDLIAEVSMNVFANYVAIVAKTEVDFPRVERNMSAA